MLVLTRNPGQGIQIGDEIIVRVLSIKGSHVRIGIEAPNEVLIVRQELLPNFETGETGSTQAREASPVRPDRPDVPSASRGA